MGKLIDLTGKRFGRLTVLERAPNRGKKVRWLCKCDCGNTAVVYASALKQGDTSSCGCYNVEISTQRIIKHQAINGSDGRSKTKLYWVWVAMRNRCNNPNNYSYGNYGGRGIRVCPEWDSSYDVFARWALSHGYSEGLSIDRIDNNGNYAPENCRWVSWKVQHRNQRVSKKISFDGKTKTLIEWSEETGISHGTLSARLRSGWPIERALTEPVKKKI